MARQMGVTEERLMDVTRWQEADFSPRERAALRYADVVLNDPHGVDQGLWDELKQHFSEEQLVELGAFIALNVGFIRLIHTWGLVL